MTDPSPNNLPEPEPLSPAAQAVMDAFLNGYICGPSHGLAFQMDRNGIAAAFRAAAAHLGSCNPSEELIRIAKELEGQ